MNSSMHYYFNMWTYTLLALATQILVSKAIRCSVCNPNASFDTAYCDMHRELTECSDPGDHCSLILDLKNDLDVPSGLRRQCIPGKFSFLSDSLSYYCQNAFDNEGITVNCICGSDECNIHNRTQLMQFLTRNVSYLQQPDSAWYPVIPLVETKPSSESYFQPGHPSMELRKETGSTCFWCRDTVIGRKCERTNDYSENTLLCSATRGCYWEYKLSPKVNGPRVIGRGCSYLTALSTARYPYRCYITPAMKYPDMIEFTDEVYRCTCSYDRCNYYPTGALYDLLRNGNYPTDEWFGFSPPGFRPPRPPTTTSTKEPSTTTSTTASTRPTTTTTTTPTTTPSTIATTSRVTTANTTITSTSHTEVHASSPPGC